MVDIMEWRGAAEAALLSARSTEWAAETVLDFRDALPAEMAGGRGSITPATSISVGGCSSRSSSSGAGAGTGAQALEAAAPRVDIEALLQALLVEGGVLEDECPNPSELEAAASGPPRTPSLREMRRIGPLGALHEDVQTALLAGPLYEYGNGEAASHVPPTDRRPHQLDPPTSARASVPTLASTILTPGGSAGTRLTLDWLLRLSEQPTAPSVQQPGGPLTGRSFIMASTVAGTTALHTARTEVGALASARHMADSIIDGSAHAAAGHAPSVITADVLSDSGASQVTVLQHFEDSMHFEVDSPGGPDAEEEVVSVFDVSDEPPSARAAAYARTLLGGLASPGNASPHSWEESALWSTVSSARTHTSLRPSSPGLQDGLTDEAGLLSSSLSSMLRRLTLESSLLDDSLTRSVRRVLQLGTVLTGQRLSDEEIRALPKVRFESAEQQQCSICLEGYQEGELLTALRCSHFFHIDCLARWMQRATICPLCRTPCGQDFQG